MNREKSHVPLKLLGGTYGGHQFDQSVQQSAVEGHTTRQVLLAGVLMTRAPAAHPKAVYNESGFCGVSGDV